MTIDIFIGFQASTTIGTGIAKAPGGGSVMKSGNPRYYLEIQILVDGWPYNLSEFDFRTWFVPGSCPKALETEEIRRQKRVAALVTAVSGNRRRTSVNRRLLDRRK